MRIRKTSNTADSLSVSGSKRAAEKRRQQAWGIYCRGCRDFHRLGKVLGVGAQTAREYIRECLLRAQVAVEDNESETLLFQGLLAELAEVRRAAWAEFEQTDAPTAKVGYLRLVAGAVTQEHTMRGGTVVKLEHGGKVEHGHSVELPTDVGFLEGVLAAVGESGYFEARAQELAAAAED